MNQKNDKLEDEVMHLLHMLNHLDGNTEYDKGIDYSFGRQQNLNFCVSTFAFKYTIITSFKNTIISICPNKSHNNHNNPSPNQSGQLSSQMSMPSA